MSNLEIKSVNGRTLFVSTKASVRDALVEAVSQGANLQDAYLQGANLQYAYLQYAYLQYANLQDAYLQGANLQHANLRGANLQHANLQHASLQHANLRGANLQDANLQGANLQGANLQHANLQDANLRGANLQHANLQDANLQDAKNAELAIARTRIIPDEGKIIGWKKADDNRIVKLGIPSSAKRSHASGRKCRAERAKVLAIYNPDGSEVSEAASIWDSEFIYRVGETVKPKSPFDTDMWNECSSGIHFYITKIEAENHA